MKKYIPTPTEVYIHSQVEGLPKDLVDKIFSIRKKGYRNFIQRMLCFLLNLLQGNKKL